MTKYTPSMRRLIEKFREAIEDIFAISVIAFMLLAIFSSILWIAQSIMMAERFIGV